MIKQVTDAFETKDYRTAAKLIKKLLKENRSNIESSARLFTQQETAASIGKATRESDDVLEDLGPPWLEPTGEKQAKISDLCDQDKAKIAKLIQQVIRQNQENEEITKHIEESEKVYHNSLEELRQENAKLRQNYETQKSKFAQSLTMLKAYQEKIADCD